jgi:hypothetical protein
MALYNFISSHLCSSKKEKDKENMKLCKISLQKFQHLEYIYFITNFQNNQVKNVDFLIFS